MSVEDDVLFLGLRLIRVRADPDMQDVQSVFRSECGRVQILKFNVLATVSAIDGRRGTLDRGYHVDLRFVSCAFAAPNLREAERRARNSLSVRLAEISSMLALKTTRLSIEEIRTPANGIQWCYSHDEETFSGPFDTREEAISEGECDADGKSFYIAQCVMCTHGELANGIGQRTVDHLMEVAMGTAEASDGYEVMDYPGDISQDIEALVVAYLSAHVPAPRFFTPERLEEVDGCEPGEEV